MKKLPSKHEEAFWWIVTTAVTLVGVLFLWRALARPEVVEDNARAILVPIAGVTVAVITMIVRGIRLLIRRRERRSSDPAKS